MTNVKINKEYEKLLDIPNEYKDDAYKYCVMVLSGTFTTCKDTQLACIRHLRDIKRSIEDDDFNYVYKPKRAKKVIKFIEALPDTKGKFHKLAMFQKFIISMVRGWFDDNDYLRFNKAFISMARKGGKSLLVSGLVLYSFLFDREPSEGRQIFCAANDKRQASIVFNMVAKQLMYFVSQVPELKKDVKKVRELLQHNKDGSYVMPLSRDTGAVDGFEPFLAVIDEYHAAKTNEMLELIQSGQGNLLQSLIFIISTAGFNLNAPMYTDEWPYAKEILTGNYHDEQYFAIIFEQDNEEEWQDKSMWAKSNPLINESDDLKEQIEDFLQKRVDEATQKGTMFRVLVKNFNYWMQASKESYLDFNDWKKNETEFDIKGTKAYVGLDLSRADDLTAVSFIHLDEVNKEYYVTSHSFVGTKGGLQAKIERDLIDYRQMSQHGYCTLTNLQSGIINSNQVLDYIEKYIIENNLDVQAICYDPHAIHGFIAEIEKRNWRYELIEIRQGAMTLSNPVIDFRLKVIDGQIKHHKNPLLDIAIKNAVSKNINDSVMIEKKLNREKIDPLMSTIFAYVIASEHEWDKKRALPMFI
ncbi:MULTISPECIES: terminase large subunit [Staphylococcus]|uniref:Terminase large subunit n=1 Tax=Staphylococcus warneri TaxID=1292 RepID=A0A2V3ZG29_STAWA|nr:MULTISPECIES: terminase TerL endonuclease subunit [Staphylococcus]ARM68234.1 terminase large subunit [Staphylococcus phage IME1367_01]KAB7647173.1 terminase large subunit [Staphylococcus sp. B2-b]KKI61668.1 Phage terminase, large subunit [Staphylococcus warneri]MCF7595792.1 terminase large subunit [Staphylococcus warneri]MCK6087808.1 terminase large subunit [Staphylococcus warneri]